MLTRRAFLLNTVAMAATPAIAKAAATPTVLKLQRRIIDVNGRAASVYGIRQASGVSGLSTKVGASFRVRVENELGEPSLVHWHGLTPPWRQDGVPEVTGPVIAPGDAADYDFPLTFGGTYWMHSHVGFQEQSLMSAPLIIHDGATHEDLQEVVVMLADFSFRPAEEIYASLIGKKRKAASADMPASHGMHMGKAMAGPMTTPMARPDLNDVTYDAFLANDRTLADPEVIRIDAGGRVLLRIINGASMSAFHVDLGEIEGKLVAVDGQKVLPIAGRRFPIASAQRFDILLETPKQAKALPVLFVLEGERRRTGVILAPAGATIERVPELAAEASTALNLDLESQLRAIAPLDQRKADRVYSIDLTGDMASYVWSLNNVVWSASTPPLPLALGERVEIALTNRTMMSHPMHLHGHQFQVVEIDGARFPGAMRDTVLVPPGKRVVMAFDANNPGRWAFHCHLLYHMHAGMFATFAYS
ncbi:multicopper oxidase family protein [Methylocystis sp. WRRC1]|uniref:multicopper oxidase family protein n=1 Tax=Methylocystis sp. WRRC1 TaxID=1732014 RepID=UPI001D15E0D3|nr:multicopper oxidase family protein [Methylocystis sp. WRRC1]MCC3245078.1 multicopper oxidase family protein [Methylocystis sp. WRRC1]